MLPTWNGADVCYNRARQVMDHMAKNGHVTICKQSCSGTRRRPEPHCHVSQELRDAVTMLDRGDEESIKSFVLNNISLWS